MTSGWQEALFLRRYTAAAGFKTGDFVEEKFGGYRMRTRHTF